MTSETAPVSLPEWRKRGIRTRITRSENQILQAASDLLAERGYDQVTVAEVARRAGVGPATVYNRFGTKGRLLACAVFNPRLGSLEAAARKDLQHGGTAAAVTQYLRRASRLLAGHRRVTEGFLAALGEVPDPEAHLDAMAIMPMPRPVVRMVVRPGMRVTRYMRLSVLPVPGGPYSSKPRLRDRPASRSQCACSAKPIVCCSMRSSRPSARITSERGTRGRR